MVLQDMSASANTASQADAFDMVEPATHKVDSMYRECTSRDLLDITTCQISPLITRRIRSPPARRMTADFRREVEVEPYGGGTKGGKAIREGKPSPVVACLSHTAQSRLRAASQAVSVPLEAARQDLQALSQKPQTFDSVPHQAL